MTHNPLVQAVDIIITAFKTFDKPFLTRSIKITKPSVSLEGNGERVELWFNAELVVGELNKIQHRPLHHLTIPMANCDIPTVTAMITGVLIDSVLTHANDIAFGKEGTAEDNADVDIGRKFVWQRPAQHTAKLIDFHGTFGSACEMFNNCSDTTDGWLEVLIEDPTTRIVSAILNTDERTKLGFPITLVWTRIRGSLIKQDTTETIVPVDCFTSVDKFIRTTLVPLANELPSCVDNSVQPTPQ